MLLRSVARGQVRRTRRRVRCFFFNDTAPTEIYTLSLHDALPIWRRVGRHCATGHPYVLAPIRAARIGARDRKSGSAGMPRPISYAVFCLEKIKAYSASEAPTSSFSMLIKVFISRSFHKMSFFFNDTATPEIYPLSLHDALPI